MLRTRKQRAILIGVVFLLALYIFMVCIVGWLMAFFILTLDVGITAVMLAAVNWVFNGSRSDKEN